MVDDTKTLILHNVDDLVSNFLYYDRKNDEELHLGEIEDAIEDGTIELEEIVERFRRALIQGI